MCLLFVVVKIKEFIENMEIIHPYLRVNVKHKVVVFMASFSEDYQVSWLSQVYSITFSKYKIEKIVYNFPFSFSKLLEMWQLFRN